MSASNPVLSADSLMDGLSIVNVLILPVTELNVASIVKEIGSMAL